VRLQAALDKWLRADLGARVSVRRPGTSGYNPAEVEVATEVPVAIVLMDWRQARVAVANYDHPVTHQLLMESTDGVEVGDWLVETQARGDDGEFVSVGAEGRRFLVLGVEPVEGVRGHCRRWRGWLWERSSRMVEVV